MKNRKKNLGSRSIHLNSIALVQKSIIRFLFDLFQQLRKFATYLHFGLKSNTCPIFRKIIIAPRIQFNFLITFKRQMPTISNSMAVHFELHRLYQINRFIFTDCKSIPMFLLPHFKKII